MAELAQELVDCILDFLHDDRKSLLSSSLVSRTWVPATRHHLFERVAINNFFAGRHGYHRFTDNAHKFLTICGSPHCTIITSIRNVVLNVNTQFTPAGPVPQLLADIIDVLARAPVNKLLFIDHTSSLSLPISLAWIAPRLAGLRDLSYNALERPAEDIFALVASFPALRVLSVYSSPKGAPTASITHGLEPHPTFAHLHTLRARLYAGQSEELLSWPHSAGNYPNLETLDLTVFHGYHNGWGPVAALNAFLRAHGDHLRHLVFRVSYEDSDDDVDEMLRVEQPSHGERAYFLLLSS